MIHIKRVDEMLKPSASRKINESYGDESFLDFFKSCAGMYDLYKFDKLCPDLDLSDEDVEDRFQVWDIDIKKIGRAYYDAIFTKFKDHIQEEYGLSDDVIEKIEMDENPIEFYYTASDGDNKYFETIKELMDIIENDGNDDLKAKIMQEFESYKRKNGHEPLFANANIVWTDDESENDVVIKLTTDVIEGEDDNVIYYCDGIDDFLSLLQKNDNPSDFRVVGLNAFDDRI